MTILYHHRTQGKGVEGVHIRGMAEAFRRLGHKVIVVSPPGVDPFMKSNDSRWTAFAKTAPEIIFEISELLYNFWARRKMAGVIKNEGIDFIYERYALNTFAGLDISKKYNIPLILEVNDATGIERVRKLKVNWVARAIEKKVFNGAIAIVTISSYFKNIIAEMGIKNEKIHVIPNAVNEEIFRDEAAQADSVRNKYAMDGEKIVGYVGSFLQWHGVDLLLKSFKAAAFGPGRSRLLLVGEGLTLDDTRRLVNENGLADHVIFTGKVPHDEIPSYIQAMDICVIPDSNDYGSPMKLFEYMAMGKPVVAPKLLPMEDIIKSGENGILFKSGDTADLAVSLDLLLKDDSKRDFIGRAARNTVLDRHTWMKNAGKVIEIYKGAKWN